MSMISSLVISLLILLGSVVMLLGSVGLVRFPDLYNRMHATTKTSTLGAAAILLGGTLWGFAAFGHTSIKLLVAIAFLFLTSPVGAHMIARSAYRTGYRPWAGTIRNDLPQGAEGAPRE